VTKVSYPSDRNKIFPPQITQKLLFVVSVMMTPLFWVKLLSGRGTDTWGTRQHHTPPRCSSRCLVPSSC